MAGGFCFRLPINKPQGKEPPREGPGAFQVRCCQLLRAWGAVRQFWRFSLRDPKEKAVLLDFGKWKVWQIDLQKWIDLLIRNFLASFISVFCAASHRYQPVKIDRETLADLRQNRWKRKRKRGTVEGKRCQKDNSLALPFWVIWFLKKCFSCFLKVF